MNGIASNVAAFTFAVEGLDEELRVVRFHGTESLSQLYRFDLELAAEDSELDFAAVVGKAGLLTLHNAGGAARLVHGIVSRFEQAEQGRRFTTYRAELVPLVWLLSQRHDCRIFQELNVPDIVKKVLDGAGIPADQYRFSLQGTYDPVEYCVQYRESDLNFISRLLESEGIFFYFEHGEEGAVFVMADNPDAPTTIAEPTSVPFHERTGMVADEENIYGLRYAEDVRCGSAALCDYNFTKPALDLFSEQRGCANLSLARYDYPGVYLTPERGSQLATVRLEEIQACQKLGSGESICRRLVPGYKFTLSGHPRSSLNQEFLLTCLAHSGTQPQALEEGAPTEGSTYENQFECIPADVSYRPPMISRKPLIEGVQTAIVVGPAGEEIYPDEYGRVKVQFHWDRLGQNDEKSSCWIRVAQSWAGAAWGTMYIPRIGQEVIVNFLEGHPDRPIITGCVYHGTNRPPYKLPDHKTRSTIKSSSSKGGEGTNEIRFEDKKGDEQLFIHAEKNYDLRVKADRKELVGSDRHLIVANDQFEQVKSSKHITVVADLFEKIDGDVNTTVGAARVASVGGSDHLKVAEDRNLDVGGDSNLKTGGDHNHKVGNKFSVDSGMEIHHKAGMNMALEGGMEVHIKGGMTVVVEAGMQLSLKAGNNFIDIGPAGVAIQGTNVMINSGGAPGAGSGCSPGSPASPESPDPPTAPQEPEAAKPSEAIQPPEPRPERQYENPQAITLVQAAKDGTPFCEKCEEARRARERGG